eukprot:g9012.t1
MTVDVLLQSPDAGGHFQTLERGQRLRKHRFDPGDALIFLGHKYHCVTPVEAGCRRVLVVELWHGQERTCGHRCDRRWKRCDFGRWTRRQKMGRTVIYVSKDPAAQETASMPDTEPHPDSIGSDLEKDLEQGAGKSQEGGDGFGESMRLVKLSSTEVNVLRQSFDMLLQALGNDREAVGDAIYGTKIGALVAIKDRSRLAHAEVPNLPPGTAAAWRNILGYCGSCYRFVGDSYGERLRVIKEDWAVVQQASKHESEKASNQGENQGEGDGEGGDEETKDDSAETFSFGRMCAFSNEVMGQKTEGWMLELLQVFDILVEMISSPVHLQEEKSECDLLAINLITKSTSIDFEKFKPVMLAALRSLLPKQWSTLHENAWEWLWMTVARNLNESTMKVRAFKPYNAKMFSQLREEQLDRFRADIFTEFFARSQASQDLFKQSQSRLRYIADRVLQSSYDMFHKNKDETLDDLSALGLRHVGYGIPIELFGPFVDVCVNVMHPMVQEFPNENESTKMMWCPKDKAHQIQDTWLQL